MSLVRQVTFEAGELAPKLYGRTDSPLFGRGLKTSLNWFPTIDGQLMTRPGSLYVGETKGSAVAFANPGSAANTKVRLVKFVFGMGQTYMLEFGDRYIRFYTNGGVIESSPGVPLEIATPYAWSSLPALQFAQTGNILVLTQAGYDAQQLERLGNSDWTLTPVTYTAPAWPGLAYTPAFQSPFSPPGSPLQVQTLSNPMLVFPLPGSDPAEPAREWQWATTLIGQDPKTGRTFETLPFLITQGFDGTDPFPAPNPSVANLQSNQIALYTDKPVIIAAMRTANSINAPSFVVKTVNIYRGRGNIFGFVGTTLGKGYFVDIGDEPNFALQPPLGQNPFQILNPDTSVLRTEKPVAVAFFQDRLTFGGAWDNDKLSRAGWLFFSATGRWNQFDVYQIPAETMSLQFNLATASRQEIRTLLNAQKLLIGTDTAVHSCWGSQGSPLSASSIPDVRVEAHVGCSNLRMLQVRAAVLFAEGGQPAVGVGGADFFSPGLAVHALSFADAQAGYANQEVSAHASHLFYGDGAGIERALVDWDYAAKPWGQVWAVRQDGSLLSGTYNAGNGIMGWARHTTDGLYENVCTVREGQEDAVYVVVNRTVKGKSRRFIERFTSRSELGGSKETIFGALAQHADDICVDSGQYYLGAATTHLTGLDHLEGKSVWVLREGLPPIGPYVVAAGAIDIITATPVGKPTYVGLLYQCDLETLAVGGERERQKTLRGLLLELKDTRGLQAGPDLTHLKDVKQLTVTTGYKPVTNQTKLIRITTLGAWDSDARAAVRQNLPLPATILGLSRDVAAGDGSQP